MIILVVSDFIFFAGPQHTLFWETADNLGLNIRCEYLNSLGIFENPMDLQCSPFNGHWGGNKNPSNVTWVRPKLVRFGRAKTCFEDRNAWFFTFFFAVSDGHFSLTGLPRSAHCSKQSVISWHTGWLRTGFPKWIVMIMMTMRMRRMMMIMMINNN